MRKKQNIFCPVSKHWIVVVIVLVLHLVLGVYYAGNEFLDNMATAVPRTAAGGEGGPQYMLPGDHFEQLYRYSLPKHNLRKGRPLYESGFQYNLTADAPAYREGWVFFPFSLLHTGLSFLFGDVATYNLIALLSFPLVGGAMFWLVFTLTRSYAAALLSSLLLALLPHRISFLFGEMVYGVDLMWPPLIVLAFEKAIRTLQSRYAAVFGVVLFFYVTSNVQAFYMFSLFSLPYFMFRAFQTIRQEEPLKIQKLRQALVILASMLPVLIYLYSIQSMISTSGLADGQVYAATTFYSPTLLNAFTVWSGNEKTIYLGWPFLLILMMFFTGGIAGYLKNAANYLSIQDRSVFLLTGLTFVVSYLFCFGPHLDTMLNINLYRWYFDHIPGANGTRTPGRLMGTAGFHFALFFGFLTHLTIAHWKDRAPFKRLAWPLTLIVAFAIVYDYKYTKPLLVKLEPHNAAYESIRGTPGIVYTVPTQMHASHYLNATFLYYAQKYDLKIFSGHSSIYPKEWDKIIGDYLPINDGQFDRAMMMRFRARGITHLSVHTTDFEPSVPRIVLSKLKQSPYLHQISDASGVTIFSIDYDASGEQTFEPNKLMSSVQLRPEDYGIFTFLDGWYTREIYPNQRPFRWMHGTQAKGVVLAGNKRLKTAEFAYRCPVGGLTITINDKKVFTEGSDDGDWTKITLDLAAYGKDSFFFEFYTPKIFKAPPDPRDFGCMVSDIAIRE